MNIQYLNSMIFFKLQIIFWLHKFVSNLQNHPTFHSQERLLILVRGRECSASFYHGQATCYKSINPFSSWRRRASSSPPSWWTPAPSPAATWSSTPTTPTSSQSYWYVLCTHSLSISRVFPPLLQINFPAWFPTFPPSPVCHCSQQRNL